MIFIYFLCVAYDRRLFLCTTDILSSCLTFSRYDYLYFTLFTLAPCTSQLHLLLLTSSYSPGHVRIEHDFGRGHILTLILALSPMVLQLPRDSDSSLHHQP